MAKEKADNTMEIYRNIISICEKLSFQPTRDWVLIKEINEHTLQANGVIFPPNEVRQGYPPMGEVVKTGPYGGVVGNTVLPSFVKEGDIISYTTDVQEFRFIMVQKQKYLLIQQKNIIGIWSSSDKNQSVKLIEYRENG